MIIIFCFYKRSSGIQAPLSFSKEFKHCNVITYDGDVWLSYEFDSQGIKVRQVNTKSTKSLIHGLKIIKCLIAMVVVYREHPFSVRWKPCIVRSCNEFDRYISSVNTGFTFNPKHLYNKLLSCNGSNYEILCHWRR